MGSRDIESMLMDCLDFAAITSMVAAELDVEDVRAQSEYAFSRGLDVDDIDFRDPDTLADFKEFADEHAETRANEAFDNVVWNLQSCDDGIRVWRSIMVDPTWLQDEAFTRPLGVFWSFDKDAAECHWGDFAAGKQEIRIEGIVNPDDVDWDVTISINARMEEEKEIRVKESAFITVVSATWVPPYGRGEEITEEFSAILPAGSEAASLQTGVLTPA